MSSKKDRNPKPLAPKKSVYRPLWITLGVILGFVGIIAAFTFGSGGMSKVTEVPAALTEDGGILVSQEDISDEPVQPTIGPAAQAAVDPAEIILVQDYNCSYCGGFEKANHDFIDDLIKEGAATVEYRPVAIQGDYSTRAANAAVCIAGENPNAFYKWNGKMFESGTGLTNEKIISIAEDSGVNSEIFTECVEEQENGRWIAQQSVDVFSNPLAGSSPEKTITGTPGIFVNGQQFQNLPEAFPEFFASVLSGATPGEAPEEDERITVPVTPIQTESPVGG